LHSFVFVAALDDLLDALSLIIFDERGQSREQIAVIIFFIVVLDVARLRFVPAEDSISLLKAADVLWPLPVDPPNSAFLLPFAII
jgi:hypothetical protein